MTQETDLVLATEIQDYTDLIKDFSRHQLNDQRKYWQERVRVMKNALIACYAVAAITVLMAVGVYFIPPITPSSIASATGILVPLVSAHFIKKRIIETEHKILKVEYFADQTKITLEKTPPSL